jgi:hypothetical protein
MSTVTVVPTVDLTSTPPSVVLAVTDAGTPNLFAPPSPGSTLTGCGATSAPRMATHSS